MQPTRHTYPSLRKRRGEVEIGVKCPRYKIRENIDAEEKKQAERKVTIEKAKRNKEYENRRNTYVYIYVYMQVIEHCGEE